MSYQIFVSAIVVFIISTNKAITTGDSLKGFSTFVAGLIAIKIIHPEADTALVLGCYSGAYIISTAVSGKFKLLNKGKYIIASSIVFFLICFNTMIAYRYYEYISNKTEVGFFSEYNIAMTIISNMVFMGGLYWLTKGSTIKLDRAKCISLKLITSEVILNINVVKVERIELIFLRESGEKYKCLLPERGFRTLGIYLSHQNASDLIKKKDISSIEDLLENRYIGKEFRDVFSKSQLKSLRSIS